MSSPSSDHPHSSPPRRQPSRPLARTREATKQCATGSRASTRVHLGQVARRQHAQHSRGRRGHGAHPAVRRGCGTAGTERRHGRARRAQRGYGRRSWSVPSRAGGGRERLARAGPARGRAARRARPARGVRDAEPALFGRAARGGAARGRRGRGRGWSALVAHGGPAAACTCRWSSCTGTSAPGTDRRRPPRGRGRRPDSPPSVRWRWRPSGASSARCPSAWSRGRGTAAAGCRPSPPTAVVGALLAGSPYAGAPVTAHRRRGRGRPRRAAARGAGAPHGRAHDPRRDRPGRHHRGAARRRRRGRGRRGRGRRSRASTADATARRRGRRTRCTTTAPGFDGLRLVIDIERRTDVAKVVDWLRAIAPVTISVDALLPGADAGAAPRLAARRRHGPSRPRRPAGAALLTARDAVELPRRSRRAATPAIRSADSGMRTRSSLEPTATTSPSASRCRDTSSSPTRVPLLDPRSTRS